MTTTRSTNNLPLLQKGDSGDSVRFLEQLLLSIYWFGTDSNKINNIPEPRPLINKLEPFNAVYDQNTANIVEQFQRNYNQALRENILVDGIVGPQTWRALGDAIFKYTFP